MMTLAERVANKTAPPNESGCIEWTGYRDRAGYGWIWLGRRMAGAHRVSYELHVGPIPEGLQIDHLCRNKSCVNPAHLEPVTGRENMRRAFNGIASDTHCRIGHELTTANSYHFRGRARCRACNLLAVRAYQERRRQAEVER